MKKTSSLDISDIQICEVYLLSKGAERNSKIHFWTNEVDAVISKWYTELITTWIELGLEDLVNRELVQYLEWRQVVKHTPTEREILLNVFKETLQPIPTPDMTEFNKILEALNKDAYVIGGESALRSLGFLVKATEATFVLTNGEVISQIGSNARTVAGLASEQIVLNAQRMLVTEVFIKGGKVSTVMEVMKLQGVPHWKAKQIVETEFQKGVAGARHEMFSRAGIKRKRWISVGDRRVRPQHVQNEDAGWIPFHEPYPNGAAHPGDGPSSIGCRCAEEADLTGTDIGLPPWDGS